MMSNEKAEFDAEPSENEMVEAVADALNDIGFAASSQDTGGGIYCLVLQREQGGEIVWGTADVTWGAAIHNADGDYVSSIETTCQRDTQDIAAIVGAIKGPSLNSGAIISRH
jgi:hypothetical protein